MKSKKFDAVEMKHQLQRRRNENYLFYQKKQLELLCRKFGHLVKQKSCKFCYPVRKSGENG
jgi:hypothetical protein